MMIPDPSVEEKRERVILKGEIPSPVHPPSGCRFHTRCPLAQSICTAEVPALREVLPGHFVACHLV
jgi:oligopeptide/dipeptide ABC transporter ATP-binding protein